MLRVTVCAVGKLKEKYLKDAVAEYAKRLGRYCTLNVIEVADESCPENAGEAVETAVRAKESSRLLAKIPDASYVIALDVGGKMLSSEELARKTEAVELSGKSHICFVIGGSIGFDDSVRERADMCLSFSKMTFPHQLMRVILLEQIYRSFRIRNGEPYHK